MLNARQRQIQNDEKIQHLRATSEESVESALFAWIYRALNAFACVCVFHFLLVFMPLKSSSCSSTLYDVHVCNGAPSTTFAIHMWTQSDKLLQSHTQNTERMSPRKKRVERPMQMMINWWRPSITDCRAFLEHARNATRFVTVKIHGNDCKAQMSLTRQSVGVMTREHTVKVLPQQINKQTIKCGTDSLLDAMFWKNAKQRCHRLFLSNLFFLSSTQFSVHRWIWAICYLERPSKFMTSFRVLQSS